MCVRCTYVLWSRTKLRKWCVVWSKLDDCVHHTSTQHSCFTPADSAEKFRDLDIVVRHSCNQRLSLDRLLLCFQVNFMTVRDIFQFVCRWLDNIRFHFTAVTTAVAAAMVVKHNPLCCSFEKSWSMWNHRDTKRCRKLSLTFVNWITRCEASLWETQSEWEWKNESKQKHQLTHKHTSGSCARCVNDW